MAIQDLIRRGRLDAGLTQSELAARAQTSQPALARYETGATMPSLPTLERILRACGQELRLDAAPLSDGAPVVATSARAFSGQAGRRLRSVRGALLEAAAIHGVRRVRVFGSHAREQAKDESDLDLLVDLAPGRSLVDLAAFRLDAEQILGVRVDAATEDLLKPHVRDSALRDAVLL